jgi:phage gpG-like protein
LGKSFKQVKRDYARLKRQVPAIVGQEAERFFKASFRRQGWLGDQGLEPWPRRQGGARNQGRGILIDTGYLRDSIRYEVQADNTVVVKTDAPYAQIHNEGGHIRASVQVRRHTRRAHTRRTQNRTVRVREHEVSAHTRQMNTRIPRRQFMGNSVFLEQRIREALRTLIDKKVFN